MAGLEQKHEAACVVIDWDGRSYYWSKNNPQQSITASEYIVEQCADRLGRELTKGEKRELLKEIDPQISEGRQWFLDIGWHASGAADPWTQAQRVAQKLLNPRESWATICGLDPDLLPSAIRACHEFARRAMLTLPHRLYPTVDFPT
jgi:allophanate hydrolase subunit 2